MNGQRCLSHVSATFASGSPSPKKLKGICNLDAIVTEFYFLYDQPTEFNARLRIIGLMELHAKGL